MNVLLTSYSWSVWESIYLLLFRTDLARRSVRKSQANQNFPYRPPTRLISLILVRPVCNTYISLSNIRTVNLRISLTANRSEVFRHAPTALFLEVASSTEFFLSITKGCKNDT